MMWVAAYNLYVLVHNWQIQKHILGYPDVCPSPLKHWAIAQKMGGEIEKFAMENMVDTLCSHAKLKGD